VLVDNKVISRLRGTDYGHTVKKNIANVYLPMELAKAGTNVNVEVFGQMIPAVVTQRVLYDPKGELLRK